MEPVTKRSPEVIEHDRGTDNQPKQSRIVAIKNCTRSGLSFNSILFYTNA
jgi:hypothetical protein